MEIKGYLVFNGGDAFTPDSLDADRVWLRYLRQRHRKPRIIVLPVAATTQPQKAAYKAVSYFRRLGTFPDYKLITTPLRANTRSEYEILDKADAIVLTDGSAFDMIERIRDTHTGQILRRVVYRTAALMGTGASAMAMGAVYWFGREWVSGLGYAPHLAIVPHYNLFRMRFGPETLLADLPDGVTLVGIDEHTNLICQPDGLYAVSGKGRVTVYHDADTWREYRAEAQFAIEPPH